MLQSKHKGRMKTTYQDTVQGTTQTTTTTQGEEKETSVIKTDAMGRETENTSKDRKGHIRILYELKFPETLRSHGFRRDNNPWR